MHVGACVSILIIPALWYLKAPLVILVAASLRGSLMKHGLRHRPGAIVELELQENDCAVRFHGSMAPIPASVVNAFVHPWLVVLRLRVNGQQRPAGVVILRGSADPEAFRALRVRLNRGITGETVVGG